GEFPTYFDDLTWAEEKIHAIMICSTSGCSCHGLIPPKVFHGNICAHDMNVVSTASVLPRTPADVNGFSSIVFVGPGKFKPEQMGLECGRIKFGHFFWLKHHNRLYSDILLEPNNLMPY
ncbi:hypothetical protein BDR06DRAFT_831179, partial [Suillus hirtellus]